jgi:hypothetical protein
MALCLRTVAAVLAAGADGTAPTTKEKADG